MPPRSNSNESLNRDNAPTTSGASTKWIRFVLSKVASWHLKELFGSVFGTVKSFVNALKPTG